MYHQWGLGHFSYDTRVANAVVAVTSKLFNILSGQGNITCVFQIWATRPRSRYHSPSRLETERRPSPDPVPDGNHSITYLTQSKT